MFIQNKSMKFISYNLQTRLPDWNSSFLQHVFSFINPIWLSLHFTSLHLIPFHNFAFEYCLGKLHTTNKERPVVFNKRKFVCFNTHELHFCCINVLQNEANRSRTYQNSLLTSFTARKQTLSVEAKKKLWEKREWLAKGSVTTVHVTRQTWPACLIPDCRFGKCDFSHVSLKVVSLHIRYIYIYISLTFLWGL